MRRGPAIICSALLLITTACSASTGATSPSSGGSDSAANAATAPGTPSDPPSTSDSSSPSTSAPLSTAPPSSPSSPSSSPASSSGTQLPRGGRTILDRSRVIAYYGAPGNGALGVLGASSPESAATKIEQRAAGYNGFDRTVQPAMELIATVAQGSPGPDHAYSNSVGNDAIRRYLDVAHAHKMLLILDLQPGRASFLSQAKEFEPFLLDPSVQLALDPEWKVGPGQAPGNGRIGSSSAAGINEVGSWLSNLIAAHHLPDKLLVVHQFTLSMLPDRQNITQHTGVEMVLHADGFGSVGSKKTIFHQLHFPHPPFGIGFKLFLTQDARLMSPTEVMKLNPRPDVITYQ